MLTSEVPLIHVCHQLPAGIVAVDGADKEVGEEGKHIADKLSLRLVIASLKR